MKVIDVEQAKANLELYAEECRTSPVIVTVAGRPAFEMIPIRDEDPEFINRLLKSSDSFRQLMEERHRESEAGNVSSLDEVRCRLSRP